MLVAKRTKYYFLISLLNFFVSSYIHASDAGEILTRIGFSELNQKAIDFSLSDINGNKKSLSGYKGKWIWLVFWAPWCMPCRGEMQELEKLYQNLRDENFIVIGVSASQKNDILDFIKSNNISFPNFVDTLNVSKIYHASSIPVIYAISPEFTILGVMRGAGVSYTQINQIKELLSSKIPPINLEEKDSVDLPQSIAPPSIDLLIDKESAFLNEPVTAKIKIEWKGSSEKYVIKVPEIKLPDGVTMSEIRSTSSATSEGTSLLYLFDLKAKKAGSYQIGPIELEYAPRSGGSSEHTRIEGVTFEWKKKSFKTYFIALFIMLIVGIILLILFSRKKKVVKTKSDWPQKVNTLRSQKIHLTKNEYVSRLIGLMLEKNPSDKNLSQLLENIKYGSMSLTEEELRHYEKILDKLIKEEGDNET